LILQRFRKVGKTHPQDKTYESWYLAQSYHGKKRMIYIPKSKEKEIRGWVRNYKQSRNVYGLDILMNKLKSRGNDKWAAD